MGWGETPSPPTPPPQGERGGISGRVAHMRALVLGGAGFIGRHVCDALTAAGHAVTVFDRVVTRFDLPHVVGQLQDRATLAAAVRDQDWVFHLVGTTLPKSSNDNPTFDVQSNLVGTIGLLDACVAAGVK